MRGNSRRSPMARLGCVALAVSLCLGLSGCGAGTGTQGTETKAPTTLETAKSKLLAVQHEIIEMVPADVVVSVFENDTSSLMPCDGDAKKWAGTGQIELLPGIDRTSFLDEVRNVVADDPGWTAKDRTDDQGERTVDLLHEDGTHLIVGFWDNPVSLQVDSFSACFDFPEYEYGEKY